MQIQENVSLAQYTTYKIGGPARYFVVAKTIEEFNEALAWAKEHQQKIFVLGGGSNLLISDQGFDGLVIKSELQHLDFQDNKVIVGAGVILAYLLNESLTHNLIGLEFAAGIPGTVGGAIRGNAGTYGQSMSDVIVSIKYLDEDYHLQEMDKSQANFQYRHSIFKEKSYIILKATLQLQTGDVNQARQLINERLKYRQVNHPHEPSCGCIFKNVNFTEVDLEDLKHRGLDIDQFAKHQKIPAGYLIEQVDLKGKQIGQAKISEQHANYIINLRGAKAEEVIMLMSLAKQQVRDKYNIQLQEEVQVLL
jgi:UDP-N-acetylmuramate dehydrogenase